MVPIPGGASTRASSKEPFTVAPFCLDRLEVSARQYLSCARDPARRCAPLTQVEKKVYVPGRRLPPGTQCNGASSGRLDHPANCVTWAEAVRFCEAAGKRLPTADEWEIAMLGPGGAPGYASAGNLCNADCASQGRRGVPGSPENLSTVRDGWPATAPVGAFPLDHGAFGNLDMIGNVSEWTADPDCTPRGACASTKRVVLGYSWFDDPHDFEPALRRDGGEPETVRRSFVGFRCAR